MQVTLSFGTQVRVGPLKWQAYKQLKTRVLEIIADKVMRLFQDRETLTAEALRPLLADLAFAVDTLNEEFVAGCIDKPDVLKNELLEISDMQALFAAALEQNPIAELLEREKNSPAGELAQMLLAKMPSPAKVFAGGSPSSLNVFDPGGDPQS